MTELERFRKQKDKFFNSDPLVPIRAGEKDFGH
jgi:hypothetical protein